MPASAPCGRVSRSYSPVMISPSDVMIRGGVSFSNAAKSARRRSVTERSTLRLRTASRNSSKVRKETSSSLSIMPVRTSAAASRSIACLRTQ